ncbi:miraculin-like [Andrographis paniculata]|uniref:miraculin-like n=1 Tax=Andrographis paniculata TaxID=175694 RepID=UPI0021E702A9|nr:miraculin-like [Andrographis paniculata]
MFETSNYNSSCANSTVWQVGDADPATGLPLITIGGALGNPSCDTVGNWFKIERGFSDTNHRLVWHPNDVCNSTTRVHELIVIDSPFRRTKRMVRSNGKHQYLVSFARVFREGP